MLFGKRKKFNGQVAALFPTSGFDFEEAGLMKTLDVLDIAWQQRYTEHEAALYCAYLVFSGTLKAGVPKANEVIDRIRSVQQDWVTKGLVGHVLASRFLAKAEEWIVNNKA